VLNAGRALAPSAAAGPAAAAVGANTTISSGVDIAALILQIAIVIATARTMAWVFQRLRQPAVVGEMFGGIMLGPSLLGWIAPHTAASLFPAANMDALNGLSQLGVAIYMFLVGLGLNHKALEKQGHAAVLTSHVSIVAPFALGAAIALALYPLTAPAGVGFTGFALFTGASMSITAFPVLARILAERRMQHTDLGTLAISCAAVDDVTGWCILAYIVLLVRANTSALPLWGTLAGLAIFVAAMLTVVRRGLASFGRAFQRDGRLSDSAFAIMLLVPLAAAFVTERLGLHVLFGAFLAGAAMPRDAALVQHVTGKLEAVTSVLLLPLYFAFTGLRTSIRLIDGRSAWLLCLAIIALAIIGKLGGSAVAARASGSTWRNALRLGALMNTRGLMELVILNIGLDIGVISPALFSMMVVMALVTTFMTTPLLELIER
jgi:Kef-type K+ transport system membrane component KefB